MRPTHRVGNFTDEHLRRIAEDPSCVVMQPTYDVHAAWDPGEVEAMMDLHIRGEVRGADARPHVPQSVQVHVRAATARRSRRRDRHRGGLRGVRPRASRRVHAPEARRAVGRRERVLFFSQADHKSARPWTAPSSTASSALCHACTLALSLLTPRQGGASNLFSANRKVRERERDASRGHIQRARMNTM